MSSRTVLAGSMVALGWLFLRALCCPAGCASASLHTVIYPLPAHPLRLHFRKLQTCTKKPGGRGFLSFIFSASSTGWKISRSSSAFDGRAVTWQGSFQTLVELKADRKPSSHAGRTSCAVLVCLFLKERHPTVPEQGQVLGGFNWFAQWQRNGWNPIPAELPRHPGHTESTGLGRKAQWDGLGWDIMGWDGISWDVMGCHGMSGRRSHIGTIQKEFQSRGCQRCFWWVQQGNKGKKWGRGSGVSEEGLGLNPRLSPCAASGSHTSPGIAMRVRDGGL